MKTSKQVEQELEEEKARYEFLKNRQTELEKELKEVEQELRNYRSTSWSHGRIKYKETELERVRLIEESENLPKLIFQNQELNENSRFRVFKVTPKRIYFREINKELNIISEDFIKKDGLDSWTYQNVNVPETLRMWEEYLSKKKEVK